MSTGDVSGLLDVALEISAWECDLMRRIRAALEAGDNEEALRLTRQLVGLDNELSAGDRQGAR